MNALARAIQSENLTGTALEISEAFGVSVSLPYVTAKYDYSAVAKLPGLSAAKAEELAAALRNAGYLTAEKTFATEGFDLSHDEIQGQLTALAANPALTVMCNQLKAIGRPTQIRWQKCGLPSAPNEAQVLVALNQIIVDTWAQSAKSVIDQLNNSGESTIAAIKTAIAELV